MKIKQAEYVDSAVKSKDYPYHNLDEIALAGRSNVGKSSFINAVVNRRKLAHTGSKPGRTQTVNFYRVDTKVGNNFYFVDLPGYGFSKASKQEEEQWAEMIEEYLFRREMIRGLILIVDARHKPTTDDQMMIDWLREVGFPFCVVATKVDKLKRSQRNKQEKLIKATLNLAEDRKFIFFSAKTSEGKREVFKYIKSLIS